MGDCKQHGDALHQKHNTHQKRLQETVQSEKSSLEENSKGIADWSTSLCTSLENSAAAVDHFLAGGLTKDMPTGEQLTHCGLIIPMDIGDVGHHWFRPWLCRQIGTKPLPEPLLSVSIHPQGHYRTTVQYTSCSLFIFATITGPIMNMNPIEFD